MSAGTKYSEIFALFRKLGVAIFFWLALPLDALAAACDIPSLSQLIGNWRGAGSIYKVGVSEAEKVSCRISFSSADNGNRIEVSGKCATVDAVRPVGGWVECRDGNLTGPLLILDEGGFDYLTYAKKVDGRGALEYVIDVTALRRADRETIGYSLRFGLADDRLDLEFTGTDGASERPQTATLSLKQTEP